MRLLSPRLCQVNKLECFKNPGGEKSTHIGKKKKAFILGFLLPLFQKLLKTLEDKYGFPPHTRS